MIAGEAECLYTGDIEEKQSGGGESQRLKQSLDWREGSRWRACWGGGGFLGEVQV